MKKTAYKLLLDIVLCFIWIMLMSYSFTGSLLHEMIGTGLLILLTVHLILNRKWITNMSKKLTGKKFDINSFKYILDIVLLIATLFTVISGILISKELFTFITVGDYSLISYLHNLSSYIALAVTGVHVGIHVKMIAMYLKSAMKLKENKPIKIVFNILAAAVIVYGIKSSITYNFPEYKPVNGTSGIASINKNTTDSTTSPTFIMVSATGQSTASSAETLEDYLGKLYCTACHRHCSLLSPRCNRGVQQASAAEQSYYSSNASSEGSKSSEAESSADSQNGFGEIESESGNSSEESNQQSDNSPSAESNEDSQSNTPPESGESSENLPESESQPTTEKETGNTIPDTAAILGMYVFGTYYVLKFLKI